MIRRSRIWREEGGALVELVLTLPLLVLVLAITVDFARIFNMSVSLTNAARAGAQYGAANLGQSGQTSAMEAAATSSVNISGIEAEASRTCQCATDAGVFSSTSPSANNCTAPAATSCPGTGTHRVVTVTVTTSKTFNAIMGFPGIPQTLDVSRTATLRVSE